ncbi:hypothetical protein BKA70DRAFT_1242532 [Coprinopsis sp. MPI-PUGE-AT-0042]|nr:hypothetical protein BKA70DRAFT_1242532 [Coprinopsis sp. MPI-PUGE-AT-0042]
MTVRIVAPMLDSSDGNLDLAKQDPDFPSQPNRLIPLLRNIEIAKAIPIPLRAEMFAANADQACFFQVNDVSPTTEDGTKIQPSLLEAHSVNSAFRIPSCFCGDDVEVCDRIVDGQEKEFMKKNSTNVIGNPPDRWTPGVIGRDQTQTAASNATLTILKMMKKVPDNFIEWASDSESDYGDAFVTGHQEPKPKKRYLSPEGTRPEKRLRIADAN